MSFKLKTPKFSFKKAVEIKIVPTKKKLNTIIESRRPIIFRGYVNDWPIMKYNKSMGAILEYLQCHSKKKNNHAVAIGSNKINNEMGLTEQMKVNHIYKTWNFNKFKTELINKNSIDTNKLLYLQASSIKSNFPKLYTQLNQKFAHYSINPKIWIGDGQLTPIHSDSEHNFTCCVCGIKRFIIFPPQEIGNLYLSPIDKNPAGTPVSTINTLNYNLSTHPKFELALKKAIMAELYPGDVLFLPAGWYHEVQSEGFNTMINYWWKDISAAEFANAKEAFNISMASIKNLPKEYRDYWKIWFDHYVFQINGDPYEHIQQRHQGVYGKSTPYRKKKLKILIDKIFAKRLFPGSF